MTALRAALGVGCLLLPGAVLAHSPIKGLDNFYAGFLHPVFVPSHLLSTLALGILFGQQGPRALQPAIIAFLVAILTGLAATLLGLPWDLGLGLLVGAALTGSLVAIDRRLPLPVYLLLASLLGTMIGVDSAQDDLAGRGRLAALLGTAIAAYLMLLYAMVFADWLAKGEWQRIGLRVLGSWAAASALLVLSLRFAA